MGLDRDIILKNGVYHDKLIKYADDNVNNETAEDAVRLYRRIMHEAKGKIEIAEIGFLQILAKVLESSGDDISEKTGIELVSQKVERLWLMAGRWDADAGHEYNIDFNEVTRKAADTVFKKITCSDNIFGL